MFLVLQWLVVSLIILVLSFLLPGVGADNVWAVIVMALVWGLFNAVLRPILLFLTLPINILTLGLFTLVVNAFVVWLASVIVPGFTVDGFWWALLFAVLLSIANAIFLPREGSTLERQLHS